VMDMALHLSLVGQHFYCGQVLDERFSPITTGPKDYQD
jgi:hypothetical protein